MACIIESISRATPGDVPVIPAWTHLYNLIEPYILLVGTATSGGLRAGRHAAFASSSFIIRGQVYAGSIASQRLFSLVVGSFRICRWVRCRSRAPRR